MQAQWAVPISQAVKLFTLPDDTEVFCGHGEDTTIGTEKATNPYTRE